MRANLLNKFSAARCLPILLIMGFLFGCSEAERPELEVERYLESARQYHGSYQYAAATIEARNAMRVAPADPRGFIRMARVELDVGQARAAISTLEPITPRTPEVAILLARAYLAAGKQRSAREVLEDESISEAQRTGAEYKVIRGQVELADRNYASAIELFNSVLAADPQNADGLMGLANTALAEAEILAARKHLAAVLEIDPGHAEALLILARLARGADDLEQEEDHLMQAIASLPSADMATPLRLAILTNLRDNLTSQGRNMEARVYSDVIKELLPGVDENVQDMQAAIDLLSEGRFDEASQSLQAITARTPGSQQANSLLAMVEFLRGDRQAAALKFEEVIDPETASIMALQMFAVAELELGQPGIVVDRLSKDIDTKNDPRLNALYGIALAMRGEPEKGESYLRKAIQWRRDPEDVRYHTLLARFLDAQQRREDALEVLQAAYEQAPADGELIRDMIGFHLGYGDLDAADRFVEMVMKEQPENQQSLLLAAAYYLGQDRLEKSEYALKALLALGPTRLGQHLYAQVLLNKGDFSAAASEYRKLYRQNSEDRTALRGLIRAYELAGDAEEGLAEVQSLHTDGDSQNSALALAEYYGFNGDLERAEQWLNSYEGPETPQSRGLWETLIIAKARNASADGNQLAALQLLADGQSRLSDSTRILQALVSVNISARQLDDAEQYLVELEARSEAWEAIMLRGDLENRRSNYLAAREAYTRAWQMQPEDRSAFKLLGVLQVAGRPPEEILAFLDEWLVSLPDSEVAATARASFLYGNEQLKEAEAAYKAILERNPDNFIALNNLAWVYGDQGQWVNARDTGRRAHELAPDRGDILDTYGWFLFKAGDTAEAVALLRKAAQMVPDDPMIVDHLREAEAGAQ